MADGAPYDETSPHKKVRSERSSFTGRVLLLAGGTAVGQAIVIAASPLLTRLYTPDDFGFLAAYTAVLALLTAVATLRYHLAVPLPEDDGDGFALVFASLLSVVGFSAITGLGLAAFGPSLLRLVNSAGLEKYTWILVLGILGSGAYQVFTYWAIRQQRFRPLATTKLLQGAVLASSQVALGLITSGPMGLMLGDAVGRTAGTGSLARLSLNDVKRLPRSMVWPRLLQVIARYRRFPIYSAPSALLNAGGLQLPAILLLAFYGPQVAGWYALTMRVFGIPMSLVGTSASQVYTSSIADLVRRRERLDVLYSRTAFRLFLVALPISALAILLGPSLFSVVFSADWVEAGQYARLLAPMFLAQFVASPLSQTLNVMERQDIQFVWDALRLLLVGGSLVVANSLDWSATSAVTVVSASLGTSYVLLIAICWRLATSAPRGLGSQR